jgi:hypothetical protein
MHNAHALDAAAAAAAHVVLVKTMHSSTLTPANPEPHLQHRHPQLGCEQLLGSS